MSVPEPDAELKAKRVRWIVGAIALFAVVSLVDSVFGGSNDSVSSCSLLPVSDFEDDDTGINVYEDDGLPLAIDPTGGEAGSAGLVVEAPEGSSRYAQIVPVDPDVEYRFEAWVSDSDAPSVELTISFLDDDFEPIGDEEDDARLSITGLASGSHVLTATAPAGSLAARPTVSVADVAPGESPILDNLTFSPVDCGS